MRLNAAWSSGFAVSFSKAVASLISLRSVDFMAPATT
jgi:hypothetical protein